MARTQQESAQEDDRARPHGNALQGSRSAALVRRCTNGTTAHWSRRAGLALVLILGAVFPAVSPVNAQDDAHPTLRLGSAARVSAKVRLQLDREDGPVTGDDEPLGGLDLARRRIGVEGVAFRVVEFEIERELQQDAPWRDVYVNLAASPTLQVQAGQFKLPFGLDENASATRLDFVHRALLSTLLAPGRDRGVMAHGRLARRVLRYEVGWFDHDGRNARTRDPERTAGGTTGSLRLRVSPFELASKRHARQWGDLFGGIALTWSDVPEGLPALRGRTVLDAPFFGSRYYANGNRRRLGYEARWRLGPAGIQGEYMQVRTQRRGQAVDDGDLSPLLATGWYLAGTWALTGEKKSRGLDQPRRPFARGGPGALELAVRIEAVRFVSAGQGEAPSRSPRAEVIAANRDRAATLGVNWYLNRWVKVQANVVRERVDDPAIGPDSSRAVFWSRLFRLQVTL